MRATVRREMCQGSTSFRRLCNDSAATRSAATELSRGRHEQVSRRRIAPPRFRPMLARVHTFAIDGLDTTPVTVEVDVRQGLPAFTIVGLGDAAVREARERVRGAI